MRSVGERAAMRARKDSRRPSAQMVVRVAVSPLATGQSSRPRSISGVGGGGEGVCSYSANAVYICLCSATAVGVICRRFSFGRGLMMPYL